MSMWQELDAWVQALGVERMTVIVRATSGAAAFMGAMSPRWRRATRLKLAREVPFG
jgi:hypothetical protein